MKSIKITILILAGAAISLILVLLFASQLSKDPSTSPKEDSGKLAASEKLASSEEDSSEEVSQEEPNENKDYLNTILGMSDEELIALAKDFGVNDPLFGLEIAGELEKGSPKYELFLSTLVTAWTEVDASGAVNHLLTLWNDEDDFKFAKFIDIPVKALASEDPAGIAALFPQFIAFGDDDLGKSRHGSHILDLILEGWAEYAPQESLSWLLEQPDFGKIDRFLSTVIKQWASQDPLKALAQVLLFEEGSEEIGVIKNAAIEVWATDDASAAVQWAVENVSEGEFPQIRDAVDQITKQLFLQESGDAAVEWVDFIPEKYARKSALETLLYTWAGADEPLSLLDTFKTKVAEGDDPLYESEFAYAAEQIAQTKPIEVAEWLNNHEELDGSTDRVAEGLIDALESDYPDAAYLWADTIQDEALREDMVYYTLTNWSHSDHKAVEEWLANNENIDNIPPYLVEELNEIVKISNEYELEKANAAAKAAE